MRRKPPVLVGVLVLSAGFTAFAQGQQTIVSPGRSVDWRNAGVPGGIPARTTACATLSPGATAAQINSAIANCPSGQVVMLNAGTYNLSAGITFGNRSNVTLRGAGPDQTFLVFSASSSCHGLGADVCVSNGETNWPGGPANSAAWSAGYAKGTTQITLSSTTHLSVGNFLVLDQLNDSSDTGQIFVCETSGVCADEGPADGERANRAQEQIVSVTAISGNTVTISPGLYMPNWRASQSPGAWWPTTTIKMSGVENLSLDHTASNEQAGIVLMNAYNCWVKNVRSLNPNRSHVWLYLAAASTVRDSYFYGTKNAASQSYGAESYMASDNLVENNIFQHITAPMMMNGAASGSVFGYNYAVDDYYNVSPSWMQSSNYHHAAGVDMVLHEGNDAIGFEGDVVHGTHHFLTAFRNYYVGWETGKTAQTNPINLYTYSRYMNVVGNVLGRVGYHTAYESNFDTAIFNLGQAGNVIPSDPLVKTTILRWGNYDTVTQTARFDPSEVPSRLSAYANPVPADHVLPPSFYLAAKPVWWGSVPWPATGPEVTGGPGPGGHTYRIPAHVCYDNSPKDANGVLTFDATACYYSPSSMAPGPPKNLRIISGLQD